MTSCISFVIVTLFFLLVNSSDKDICNYIIIIIIIYINLYNLPLLINLSHYILTLAYCKTDELSRWYIQQEMDLFKYRFHNESIKGSERISKFIEENNISAKQATSDERLLLKGIFSQPMDKTIIYKVDIIHVQNLISQRNVFIKKFVAYLPETDILSVILSHFHTNLSHRLSLFIKSILFMCKI